MSPGTALGFWLIGFSSICSPALLVIGYWSWRNGRSLRRAAAASLLPYVLIGVLLAWYLAYFSWSLGVRHVDAGIGKDLKVPLAHGYFLGADFDPFYIDKEGGGGARVAEVKKLALVGNAVIGVDKTGPFVLDLNTDTLKRTSDTEGRLETPEDFYGRTRFGWQDFVLGLLLLSAWAAVARFWYRRFIRAPRPA